MKKFDNKFLKKLEKYDRFTIIIVILAIMMAVLTLKLMHLTLIKGNYYRDIAKNNRLREVKIPAPRGNIYDRNGELLATTKNVYVANLYKDQIKQMKLDDSNDALLNLSHLTLLLTEIRTIIWKKINHRLTKWHQLSWIKT